MGAGERSIELGAKLCNDLVFAPPQAERVRLERATRANGAVTNDHCLQARERQAASRLWLNSGQPLVNGARTCYRQVGGLAR